MAKKTVVQGSFAGPAPRNKTVEPPARSSGQPLPAPLRKELEAALGQDLSQVRVHTGPEAAKAARELGAKAFTSGANIYFGQGKYNPNTPEGRALIGHETAHVQQQIKGKASASGAGGNVVQNPSLEQEAKKIAEMVSKK